MAKGTNDTARQETSELSASGGISRPPEQSVTRLEVVDGQGRAFTRWGCAIALSYQDDGRTLKVFVKDDPGVPDRPQSGLLAGVSTVARDVVRGRPCHPDQAEGSIAAGALVRDPPAPQQMMIGYTSRTMASGAPAGPGPVMFSEPETFMVELAASDPPAWQPISSAPKDGSCIVVISDSNRYIRGVVQWECGAWLDWNDEAVAEDSLTHWFALPAPPGQAPTRHSELEVGTHKPAPETRHD